MYKAILRLAVAIICVSAFCACSSENDNGVEVPYELYTVKVKSSLALRTEPSASAEKITNLYNGTQCRVIGIEGDWAEILSSLDPPSVAYANVKYMERSGHSGVVTVKRTGVLEEVYSQEEVDSSEEPEVDCQEVNTVVTNHLKVAEYGNARLSDADKAALMQIEVPSGWDFVLVVRDSISFGEVYDFANQDFNNVAEELKLEKTDNLVVLSYVQRERLLDYTVLNKKLRNYIEANDGFDIFKLQVALEATPSALVSYIAQITKIVTADVSYYDSLNWFKRIRLATSYYIDDVFDTFLIQVVFSDNNKWYVKIIRWIVKYPFCILVQLIDIAGSPLAALALLAVCLILFHFLMTQYSWYILRKDFGCLRFLVVLFVKFITLLSGLVFLTALIYFLPSMNNIVAMQLSGVYDDVQINQALNFYLREPSVAAWYYRALLVVVAVLSQWPDTDLLVRACMNSEAQRRQLKIDKIDVKEGEKTNVGDFLTAVDIVGTAGAKINEIQNSNYPYIAIIIERMGQEVGQKVGILAAAVSLFNSTLITFGLLYYGYKLINKIITLGYDLVALKRRGILI